MRGMVPSYRARPCPASRRGSPPLFPQNSSDQARLFRPWGGNETKRIANETIFRIGEDVRKLAMVTNPPNETAGRATGAAAASQGTVYDQGSFSDHCRCV